MTGPRFGGNRENTGSSPKVFEAQNPQNSKKAQNTTPGAISERGIFSNPNVTPEQNLLDLDATPENQRISSTNLGEMTKIAAEFGAPRTPEVEAFPDFSQSNPESLSPAPEMSPGIAPAMPPGISPELLQSNPELSQPNPELNHNSTPDVRPLAEGGSTEGKIDKKKILSFDGDVMDKDSQKQIEQVIKDNASNPFQLDNERNQMMVDGLRDNYGRIFGSDTYEDGASDTPDTLGVSGTSDVPESLTPENLDALVGHPENLDTLANQSANQGEGAAWQIVVGNQ